MRWRSDADPAILTRSAEAALGASEFADRIPRAAKVAELVDAPALGAGGAARGGSSPPFRTNARSPTIRATRISNACKARWRHSGPARAPLERRRAARADRRRDRQAPCASRARRSRCRASGPARCRSRWSRSSTARRCAPTSSPTPCRRASTTRCASRTCAWPAIRASSRAAPTQGATARSSSPRCSRSIPR